MKTPKPYNIPSADPYGGFVGEAPTMYMAAGRPLSLSGMTPLQKMQISKKGVSKNYLEQFKKATALGYDDLAGALAVTRATLINKKGEEKFNTPLSERIVSLADLYAYGYEVFEDTEAFNQWMQAPNQALGGLTPLSITDSLYGREEVKSLIGRIAYGVYS
ncbi:antitoxin Xre/MbcA/ParS toxin-binding domain-containing protein [Leadbetterella sp. DM7]|uniref:type II RES/Xre toxin-antitoxin system antitoxin n=1 Tax=Leadbetterella sp. DM7 TaxID=3235085 RepID=UPI00349ECF43